MDVVSAVAIYFVIWWLLFFPVLTLFDRRPDDEAHRVAGAERSAPAVARIGRRVAINTVAAAVVFAGVYALLHSGLTLDDLPFPSPPPVPEYQQP